MAPPVGHVIRALHAERTDSTRFARSRQAPRVEGLAVPWLSGIAAGGIALAVKWHYSTASADELAWILRPTVAIVSAVTGIPFAHEASVGWMNMPLRYSIVPACAGVNFWLVAFLSITFALLRKERRPGHAALGLAGAAAAAYGATLLANSLRIVLALQIHTRELSIGGFAPDVVHRTLGVLVYVPALFLVFELAERASGRRRA